MTINGTGFVTITCSSSVITLSNAEQLKIDNITFRGCYGNDSYSYGVVLHNIVHLKLTHNGFLSTRDVILSNVTTILLK